MEFECINCGQRVRLEEDEGGIVFLVFKAGSKFYACSRDCAVQARDDEELRNEIRGVPKSLPFAGIGRRPEKGFDNFGEIPDFEKIREEMGNKGGNSGSEG